MEWISVEKELPPPYEEVLATNEYDRWMVIAERKKTRWFNSWDVNNNQAVPIFPTHWMPLPEPPTQTNLK